MPAIKFVVNGKEHVQEVPPEMPLLWVRPL